MSRLRGKLGGLIELHPAGYRLAVDQSDVDVHRFVQLADAGRRALAAGDHAGAAAALREALALWRGPALADVAEASLALGEHARLVAELRELVSAYPLRERLRGQLMRALYGTGRT